MPCPYKRRTIWETYKPTSSYNYSVVQISSNQTNYEKHGTPGTSIWQSRFYERIIRSDKELNNIRDYIVNNPVKWAFDEENPDRKK